jgi:hypothetical protein
VILSVRHSEPAQMRSWRLSEDRSQFDEEPLIAAEHREPAAPNAEHRNR